MSCTPSYIFNLMSFYSTICGYHETRGELIPLPLSKELIELKALGKSIIQEKLNVSHSYDCRWSPLKWRNLTKILLLAACAL